MTKHYVDKDSNIFGIEDGQPVPEGLIEVTMAEIDAANEVKAQVEFNALPYAEKRRSEYPPIGDQLDDLFKQGAFSVAMTAKIQAVKDKYPKG